MARRVTRSTELHVRETHVVPSAEPAASLGVLRPFFRPLCSLTGGGLTASITRKPQRQVSSFTTSRRVDWSENSVWFSVIWGSEYIIRFLFLF